MRKAFLAFAGAAFTYAALSSPLLAQSSTLSSPPPAAAVIEGVSITGKDFTQLLTALHVALQPNNNTVPIVVSFKSAADMPPYDKDWHYGGIQTAGNGASTMSLWINQGLKGEALRTALESGTLLAIIDGGYAGAAFKQLYDIYAARDAQLPANAPDPYLNRHKFAAALVQAIAANSSQSR